MRATSNYNIFIFSYLSILVLFILYIFYFLFFYLEFILKVTTENDIL